MAKVERSPGGDSSRRPPGAAVLAARLDRRGVASACAAVVFLGCLFAYSGPSWALVLYQLAADGPLLAAWLLSAFGIGATAARAFRLRADDAGPGHLLSGVTAIALGLGTMGLAVLGLGLAGWLSRASAIAVVGVGVALALVEAVRHGSRRPAGEADAVTRAWFGAPAGWAWLWLTVLPLLAIAVVAATIPPGLLWKPDDPHPYDVVGYHLQVPREWYEAGRIVPLRHNVFSYFPFNVEIHYLLAMHLRGGPWNGMYLAQLMHGAFAVLAVPATYALARRLAPKQVSAVAASVAAAAVPWLTLLAAVAYNEGGMLLYGTLAVGWAVLAASRGRMRTFALAGVMAGLAAGAKLTAVPLVLCAVPAALLARAALAGRSQLRTGVAGSAVFVAAGLLAFSPWLVRNSAWAGNPVFPEAMPLLGAAHFSPAQVDRWERAHKPTPAQASAGSRFRAFANQVLLSWQFGYVLLPLAVVVAVSGRKRPDAVYFGALLALYAGFWLVLTHLQGRFFVMAVPVAALLVAGTGWGGRAWIGVAVAVAAAAVSVVNMHQYARERTGEWLAFVGLQGEPLFSQLHPPEVESLPPDTLLTLVGDAKAFWYPRGMKSLRYRTVFDVDTSATTDVVAAWRGRPVPGEWLLIDPPELERFSQTYFGIPAPPPEVAARPGPYVVAPAAMPVPPAPAPPR